MRESIEDDYQKQIDTMETKIFELDKKQIVCMNKYLKQLKGENNVRF